MDAGNFLLLEFATSKGLLLAVVVEVTSECLPSPGIRAKQVDIKECWLDFWLRLKPEEISRDLLLKDVDFYSPPVAETRRRTPRLGVQHPSSEEQRQEKIEHEIEEVEKSEKKRMQRKKKDADAKKKKEKEKLTELKKKENILMEREEKMKERETALKKKERDFEKSHPIHPAVSGTTATAIDESAPLSKVRKLDVNQRVALLNMAQESETFRHDRELESLRHDEQERALQNEWRDILRNNR